MRDLDDAASYELDASGMFGHIRAVGRELERAWEASRGIAFATFEDEPKAVAVVGMGGSATAGDYFAAICADHSPVPVEVIRGERLPRWVSHETPAVICSYSGNTAEALACYAEALALGVPMVAITRGGQLAELAERDGVPVHRVAYEAMPRATTVHALAPLLRLGAALGLCPDQEQDVSQAARLHGALVESVLAPEVPVERNRAKQVAAALAGRVPFVLGGGPLAPAAVRFRNQLAENGKSLGAADSLPEAGHNLIVGLAAAELREHVTLVTLESPALSPEALKATFEATASQFEEAGIPVHRIEVAGETVLQQLVAATAWGDYVSCYLAILRGFDPTPIPQIERLRGALSLPGR